MKYYIGIDGGGTKTQYALLTRIRTLSQAFSQAAATTKI